MWLPIIPNPPPPGEEQKQKGGFVDLETGRVLSVSIRDDGRTAVYLDIPGLPFAVQLWNRPTHEQEDIDAAFEFINELKKPRPIPPAPSWV